MRSRETYPPTTRVRDRFSSRFRKGYTWDGDHRLRNTWDVFFGERRIGYVHALARRDRVVFNVVYAEKTLTSYATRWTLLDAVDELCNMHANRIAK